MSARYQLEPLTPAEVSRWDELIAPYESRQLFHGRVWLDYLAASRGVEIKFWALRNGGGTLGYLCGGSFRKGPFRILGSPLKGWGTNFMGPVANHDLDQRAFLEALDELAACEGLAMLEIENPVLSDDPMVQFGYTAVAQPTYIVTLTPGQPEQMWKRIEKSAQQKIRKAQRHGLVVEDSNDPRVAEIFFDQFVEVLARKKLSPPYDRSCPRLLFQCLKPRDLLFALAVRDANGDVIATGLFPHDDQAVYMWGAGSQIAHWKLAPNDFLQWSLMEMAAPRGLRTYNMCGYGGFKSKFGGALQVPKRWHKCFWRSARWARRAYEFYLLNRIRFEGRWQKFVRGHGGA